MKCTNCKKETSNPKFCSRSCAATVNNATVCKRKPEGSCLICKKPIPTRLKYCSNKCRLVKVTFCSKHQLVRIKRKGGGTYCPKCSSKRVAEFRRKNKKRCIEFLGGKCLKCGYRNCPDALEFHHRNPAEKEFNLGVRGLTKSWKRIKKELIKCDLLCANCHREHHHTLFWSVAKR